MSGYVVSPSSPDKQSYRLSVQVAWYKPCFMLIVRQWPLVVIVRAREEVK